MIEFILNNQKVSTEKPGGLSLLDFIRKESHFPGTKTGCREGDCGACTVLEGCLSDSVVTYKTLVSCITPLINVQGKHIVTIEGLRMKELSPVQDSIISNSATQCGFCTPGFTISLTSLMLDINPKDPLLSISGNICRCTGYKSIERAAYEIDDMRKTLPLKGDVKSLVEKGWLPEYFLTIPGRLEKIKPSKISKNSGESFVGGGTDLLVQQYEKIRHADLESAEGRIPDTVENEGESIKIGAGININAFFNNPLISSEFPQLNSVSQLIASVQIRNMGTLAGNIANASPIGDLSILLLALDAELSLENPSGVSRKIKLRNYFLDYKRTDLKPGELIMYITFSKLKKDEQLGFEKVSKRNHLDIASVNSALSIHVNDSTIEHLGYAVGGIAPVPKYMTQTIAFLSGKKLDLATLRSALEIIQAEISPISDIRGSKEYKRLLVRQLFLQHFLTLFPEVFTNEEIHSLMTNQVLPYEKY